MADETHFSLPRWVLNPQASEYEASVLSITLSVLKLKDDYHSWVLSSIAVKKPLSLSNLYMHAHTFYLRSDKNSI